MHTASTVQFPKSVIKAQGLKQGAYAHPRDVKTDGCKSVLNNVYKSASVISIVSNVDFKATDSMKKAVDLSVNMT